MSRSEGELICFQLIAKRQLSGSFPSFQILNLQTRVRFPVALPTLFQSFTHFLTWSLQATVASFCTASTGAPYNWLRRWRASTERQIRECPPISLALPHHISPSVRVFT